MAVYTPKQLAATALTTTLTTILYTAPASTTTIITSIVACNTNTTTARDVSIAAAGGMNLLAARSLAPLETLILRPGTVITTTQTIIGGQAVGTDVEVLISGVEVV